MTSTAPLLRAALAGLIAIGCASVAVFAGAAPVDSPAARKSFDLPAGEAATTFKQFIAQSHVQLLYAADEISGVQTNAVKGEFAPQEAIEQLLAGTRLTAIHTENGSIAVKRGARPNAAGAAPAVASSDRPEKRGRADNSETIVLSPFTVNAEEDKGYKAENTLSGSRLKTSLENTPAVVSVFTEDFMQDVAANSILELVQYDANIQSEQFVADGAVRGGSFDIATPNDRNTFRSRGGTGSFSRDFFSFYTPQDPYNIDRADLSKGPNGVLFGVGAIGGIINTQSKRALLKSGRTKVELQAGSWGLMRGTLDSNYVLRKDVLALRLNLLDHEEDGYRYNTFQDKRSGTLSVTFQPTEKTLIYATYEHGKDKKSNQRPWGVGDTVSEWVGEGKKAATYTGGRAVAQDLNGIAILNANTPHFVYIDQAGALYNTSRAALTTVYNDPANQVPFRANYIATAPGNRARLLYDDPAQFGELSTSNRIGPGGPDTFNLNKFDNGMVVVEQSFTRSLQGAFSFYKEVFDTHGQVSGVVNLQADPNPQLGNGTTSTPYNAPIAANPFFKQYFIENDWAVRDEHREQHAVRALLAYELDLSHNSSSNLWNNILGRHQIAGLLETGRQHVQTLNLAEVLDYNSRVSGIWPTANITNPENDANHIFRRNYVTFGDWENFQTGRFPTTNTFTLTQSDPGINGRTVTTTWVPSGSGQISDDYVKDDVTMVALQSYFWKDRLVGTFGYRVDNVTIDTANTVRDNPALTGVVDANHNGEQYEWMLSGDRTTTKIHATSRSVGGVFHFIPQFGVFYNESSGKQLPRLGQKVSPDGRIAPGNTGTTNDYGIIFSLIDNRISGRINRYETAQRDTFLTKTGGFPDASGAPAILTLMQAAGAITQAENDAHTPTYNGGLMENSSKGYEARIVANLSDSLTFVLNYSYTDRTNQNVLKDVDGYVRAENDYYNERLATVGLSTLSLQVPASGNGANVLPQESIQARLDRVYGEIAVENLNRGYGFAERPHKVVSTLNYTFRNGFFKGVSTGGTVRWQSQVQLGHVFQFNDTNNNFTIDQNEVSSVVIGDNLQGPDFFQIDGMLRYRMTRIGSRKVGVDFQLNVFNLMNEDKVMPNALNANGSSYAQYQYRDPRSFRFTVRLDF